MSKAIIYTIAQLSTRLMQLYNAYNAHCFGGSLPRAVITVEQGKGKAYGWIYNRKMWQQGRTEKYSIMLASESLNDVQQMQITLLHEMCHLYAMENGIQDTSRGGYYHNQEFAKIAEGAGLIVTKEKQGAATRSVSEELGKWLEENSPLGEIRIHWTGGTPARHGQKGGEESEEQGGGEDHPEKPKKRSGYFVYKCPTCGATARATKQGLILACMGTAGAEHMPGKMEIED